ncbi:Cas8a1 family CRISPR/Cas system-associated protein [Bacillus sp. FJAT-42315]|uniref:Cas8a1 family CRISPR/Cas system-associated protein n=1 Tax=Bacillus sp. FJAT-42315 TaxID=2014077 RepID=UPI001E54D105|nr:Cas8a1 family CRISPR/Cas system-associated protein [Bacillus sp. FJAT-42315]
MSIKVTLDEFLYNAGVLGLLRVFDHAGVNYTLDGQSVFFDETSFENMEAHYFNYLIYRYQENTSWYAMVSKEEMVKYCLEADIDEKKLTELNKFIENTKRWLTSNSYKNTYHLINGESIPIAQIAKTLKKVTMKKKETISDIKPQIEEMCSKLLECITYLKHPEAKKFIVARNLTYTTIQPFWTNVSFLNSTASKKDMYQEFQNYFTRSTQDFIESKKNEKKYAKNKLSCAVCEHKMAKMSECFDLTWLQKVGVDAARKSSHYWNHNRDLFVCPICNLIYSCVPLGFTLVQGKGLFINNNQSVEKLKSSNSMTLQSNGEMIQFDDLENLAYSKLLDMVDHSASARIQLEIENIQVVKFDRNNEARPYTFNILSRQRAEVLVRSKKSLDYLAGKYGKEDGEYIALYQDVMRRLYNGQSFFDLLYRLLRLSASKEFSNGVAMFHILQISTNQFKGGEKFMTGEELKKIRYYGTKLRSAYRGSENKLGGILHRLLNALKVKNANKFMETLIQAYSYKKQVIPAVFVQALEDKDTFQTIGYAFLLGLEGYSGEEKKEDESNE